MTKAPQPGKVKTRLVPPLTPAEAAKLNACFLRDLGASISRCCRGLRSSQKSTAFGVAVYTPISSEKIYENILPPDFLLVPQRGESFGERLVFAAEDLFKHGFAPVCLINSDSPTVPASSFAEAATELAKEGDQIVLGPASDGGYYLIGLKKLHCRIFEAIDWSTERVLEQTRERASEIGVDIHELPAGLDVDDAATLADLCEQLFGLDAGSTNKSAFETRKFLDEIIQREGRSRIWPAHAVE